MDTLYHANLSFDQQSRLSKKYNWIQYVPCSSACFYLIHNTEIIGAKYHQEKCRDAEMVSCVKIGFYRAVFVVFEVFSFPCDVRW